MTLHSDREPFRNDIDAADLRQAYERGRRDAQAARKRHPVLMTLTVIAAIVGVVLLALAAINGSFGRAGGVVDQNLVTAADRAEPVVRGAAAQAGDAVRDAADGTGTENARDGASGR